MKYTQTAEKSGWQHRAACRDEDPDMFFASSLASEVDHARKMERSLCGRCPVRVSCLEEALRTGSSGVWAGTTTAVRDALRRNRGRQSCPGCFNKNLSTDSETSVCPACGLSWRIASKVV
jgi:WhiB family redox-sensing transcriptional regulator